MKVAFNVLLVMTTVIMLVTSTSTATATSRIFLQAEAQTLPTCTDPTGKNLPCMIVISTLPAPTNAIQCQEPTGQLLSCSYATQMLSNGQQVVVITVYVPPNFIFAGGPISVVKEVIVHETKTRVVHECPDDQILNHTTGKCVNKPPPPPPKCERPDSDAVTDLDKDLKTKNCDTADANEHGIIPMPPPSTCKDNATCPSSGGSGAGSKCVNNCTSGTPQSADCTKNPTDPSCIQSLTPSTTTPPLTSVPPSTITCPDGSTISATEKCPSTSTAPSSPSSPSTGPSNPTSPSNPSGGSPTPPS